MPNKRRKRVPEVLWRLFGDQARTLANTITSIARGSADDRSFLLRPDDRPDYRRLLNQTFVVVSLEAPHLTDFSTVNRWTQRQIVTRTIEMIMMRGRSSSNVICSSYDKASTFILQWNKTSPIVELLTSSAWICLLERVGDYIMFYLLEHTSLFLPLLQKKHHQVAGPPINSLIFKLPKHLAKPKDQNHSLMCLGPHENNDRVGHANSTYGEQELNSSSSDGIFSSFSCVGCCDSNYTRPSVKQSATKCGKSFSRAAQATTEADARNNKEHPGAESQGLGQTMVKHRKHSRPFKWERVENYRRLGAKEGNYRKMRQYQCKCCSLLYATCPVSKGALILRQAIFYNVEEHSSTVLPRKHVLNRLKPNFSGAESLFRDIFGYDAINLSKSCSHSRDSCQNGIPCMYHLLIKLCLALIRKIKTCKHAKLFHRHCFASSSNEKGTSTPGSATKGRKRKRVVLEGSSTVKTSQRESDLDNPNLQFEGTESYCSKSQVVSFIWAVCRNVVPPDLLGSPYNWRVLRRNISRFIQLRRYEKFSLNQCMLKLKATGFLFLSDKHSLCCSDLLLKGGVTDEAFANSHDAANQLKHKLLRKWVFWFFSRLVVPLVQANFYVTETESGRQDIFYYPKSTWGMLRSRAIANMTAQNYQALDMINVKNVIGKRSFGFSKLRLRPKENGIRMIANLKASSRMPAQAISSQIHSTGEKDRAKSGWLTCRAKQFKSVNYVLRDTHAVLKGILQKEPEKLGSSVFDYNDVYRKLCPFIIALKCGSTMIPKVFIVVSDVSKAFDSIDQDKLLDVMNEVITTDGYLLEQSYHVVCLKKSLWARENLMLSNPDNALACRCFGASSLFGSLHTILVNQGHSRFVKKEDLLFNLKEHVKKNVLQLDKKFYLQGVGIAQGSIVSALLCSLYYGHLERNVIFPYLERASKPAARDPLLRHNTNDASSMGNNKNRFIAPYYMLLRFIDDFLFISTSEKQAASLFSRLRRGFLLYNCYMNESKFSFNFDVGRVSGLPSNRVYVGEDASFIRWSGLLLNSRTLEVQADYTRYLKNHLSSSLTVCWHSKPIHQLKMKLYGFMRPKCHPIFFDSNINSAQVVRLNVYQAFLLSAMKFHCYLAELSHIYLLRARSCLKMIKRSIRYMHLLIKRRMRVVFPCSNLRPLLQLDEEEVEWLALNAYIQVLKRKQSRHKQLLSFLRSGLVAHRLSKDVPGHLDYAINSSRSSVLWKIKY